jgi:hypothetical protein
MKSGGQITSIYISTSFGTRHTPPLPIVFARYLAVPVVGAPAIHTAFQAALVVRLCSQD